MTGKVGERGRRRRGHASRRPRFCHQALGQPAAALAIVKNQIALGSAARVHRRLEEETSCSAARRSYPHRPVRCHAARARSHRLRRPVRCQCPSSPAKTAPARASSPSAARGVRVRATSLSSAPTWADLPEGGVFESELFGHVRGAFLDAKSDCAGFSLPSSRDGGSLFMDEIGTIPMSQQAKLLRTIETGESGSGSAHRASATPASGLISSPT